jgi:DNA polymerase III epsilon subunit-like protein
MAKNLLHNNGHIMAVIDVETTGLTPRHNDIVQVCVLPIDGDFKPLADVNPFYAEMKPKRPLNIDWRGMTTSKAVMMDILKKAPAPSKMADLFGEWYKKLPLPHNKCLMPLAHNWPFDSAFVEDWLGRKHYEHFFHPYYRDLMCAALLQNDVASYHLQQYPYPKMNLGYLCNLLGIENMKAHDALGDCMATAACYRELLRRSTWTPVVLTEDQAKEIPVEDVQRSSEQPGSAPGSPVVAQ